METMSAEMFEMVMQLEVLHPHIDRRHGHRLARHWRRCVVGMEAHRLTAPVHGWVDGRGSSRRLCLIVSARSRPVFSHTTPSPWDRGNGNLGSLDLARQSPRHLIRSGVGVRVLLKVQTHSLLRMLSAKRRRLMLNSRRRATRAPIRVLTCKVNTIPTRAVRLIQAMQIRHGKQSKQR